ncbi:tRNA lysidine(34) synthetase TilS [Streptomyces sp. A10(2020)]|uniref:tRNA lysidine(34) synthetase TilS n=1 Tax=Streptomyces sp. A10(2020) TaxID=2782013 RepID=UPI001F5CD00F|nr:tRNA lysidine(34) synthetase TilS [Streptomyces sp. A10(2020)]UNR58255.1 tRNA lysidine(34) synthetase TilS [Streptomyces sp. A10(2020)]
MGPHPAVAAIRLAVRRVLNDLLAEHPHPHPQPLAGQPGRPPRAELLERVGRATRAGRARQIRARAASGAPVQVPAPGEAPGAAPPAEGPLVLVACSGGADSMALASALAFEAPRLGIRAGGITVDHGLQYGSDARAADVVARLTALGLDPVESAAVRVAAASDRTAHGAPYAGGARRVGPEAAARDARYAALDEAAERLGAAAVLLGHTRDDQAETVLLGLARGSGIRSLSGMAAVSGDSGRYRRPFLQLDRQTARTACLAQSLPVWDDPHNTDPAYTRSRLRHEGLPALEKALGKGVVEALARTAQLSRDDADALDAWAAREEAAVRDETGELDCARLYALPAAVRRRILRRALVAAGAPAGSLFARHVEEVDRLITGWRGQRAINLPGKVEARRQGGRLVLRQG